MRQIRNDLQAQLEQPSMVNLQALLDSIARAAALGVAGAVPLPAAGDSPADRETLLAQGRLDPERAYPARRSTGCRF